MKKRILATLLSGLLLLCLPACGESKNPASSSGPAVTRQQDDGADIVDSTDSTNSSDLADSSNASDDTDSSDSDGSTDSADSSNSSDDADSSASTDSPVFTDDYDLSEPYSQLSLMESCSDLWYSEDGDGVISTGYAVTDLNRNGRLEIIKCIFNTETYFTKIRIFEVEKDYRSMTPIVNPFETMWADGEEKGWEPDLMEFSSVDCYWSGKWGSALDDYTGPSYFYHVYDKAPDEFGDIIQYYELIFSDKKEFGSWAYGSIFHNYEGELVYYDQEGIETDEEGLFKDMTYGYDTEHGYDHDKVTWSFVFISDPDSCIENLTTSYEGYSVTNIAASPENDAYR